MASFLRIKRRLEEEPAEAFLLAPSSKKFREDSCRNPNVYKFLHTIDSKNGDIRIISKMLEDQKMMSYRSKPIGNKKNISKPQSAFPSENRYTITDTFSNLNENEPKTDVKVYDLVREGERDRSDTIMCNGVPMMVEKCATESEQDSFVYDYYYSEVGTIDDTYLDQLMSVQPFEYKYESSESEDSEDSNAEDNYKNDYPDTEESHEEDSDFENLTGATGRIDLRKSVELSSDDEDFIYGSDGDINSHHSTAYSKYKKRVMKELDGDVSSETDSDGDEDECISDFE